MAHSKRFKTEAGASYLIKTDRNTILFDVGWNALREEPSPLQHNLRELGVALSEVDTIFLSHAHRDHTGGEDWVKANTFSLGNAQVDLRGKRVFAPVPLSYPGVAVTTIGHPAALLAGVASTGPIARKLFMGAIAEQALVINVEGKGLVVIVGCGHQTLPKLVKRLEDAFGAPLHGLVGDVYYPVPAGRLFAGGLDLQKRFASGDGFFSPITVDDINADLALLAQKKIGILALGTHDTSDEAIGYAERRFGDAFRRVSVGTPIRIGRR
ncbi:MBL fold metallo-hydrolase [Massilia glaciei]|uniref:MBL fold metallo-hydrolase n=1 Tax=Massilia glaciei TaxID=1524097 RepID=UPI0015E81284|nr:MBL fold metallo-hydrolase [Massilia glaciei]